MAFVLPQVRTAAVLSTVQAGQGYRAVHRASICFPPELCSVGGDIIVSFGKGHRLLWKAYTQ